jgi:hypothetical protein
MAQRTRFIQYLLTLALVAAASHAHAKPIVSTVLEHPYAPQAIIDAQFGQWDMIGEDATGGQPYGMRFALLDEKRLSEVDPPTLKRLTSASLFLPNMRLESTEELNKVLKVAGRAVFFGQLDSQLLTACPDGPHQIGRGTKYVFIRGTHELHPAVKECYPTLIVQYERVTAIHGNPNPQRPIGVNGRLDSKSLEHLRGFNGKLIVHSKRFPTWLKEVITQGRLHGLSIHGLRSITVKQATILSAMPGHVLELPDLTRLSTAEAKALSAYTGSLSAYNKGGILRLPSLADVSPEGISHLVKNRRRTVLGLTELTPASAEALGHRFQERMSVNLPKVRRISSEAAMALRPSMRVSLGTLESLSVTALEHLMNVHQVSFKVDTMTMDLAEVHLATREDGSPLYTRRLLQTVFARTDPALIKRLYQPVREPAKVSLVALLASLDTMDVELAEAIVTHVPFAPKDKNGGPATISLPAITHMTDEVLAVLAQTTGPLKLDGLSSLTNQQVKALATSTAVTLSLNSVETLIVEQAQALASSSTRSLSLLGLRRINLQAVESLLEFQGPLELPHYTNLPYELQPARYRRVLAGHGPKWSFFSLKRLHPEMMALLEPNSARSDTRQADFRRLEQLSEAEAAALAEKIGSVLHLGEWRWPASVATALTAFSGDDKRLSLDLQSTDENEAWMPLSAFSGARSQLELRDMNPTQETLDALAGFQVDALIVDVRSWNKDWSLHGLAGFKKNLNLEVDGEDLSPQQAEQLLGSFQGTFLHISVSSLTPEMVSAAAGMPGRLSVQTDDIPDSTFDALRKAKGLRLTVGGEFGALCHPDFAHVDNDVCEQLESQSYWEHHDCSEDEDGHDH